MNKTALSFLIVIVLAISPLFAHANLISYKLIKTFSIKEMQDFWDKNNVPKMILRAKDSVDVYELIYQSQFLDGKPAITSGLYFLPKNRLEPLPMLLYTHGTELWQDRKVNLRGEKSLCFGFATDGYAVAYPDYFGLGVSSKDQVYLNAELEAQSSVDLLIAIEQVNQTLQIALSGQLFVTGYSQGGHAAMATHKMIESKYSHLFKVTASSPMSGPYDVFFTVNDGKFREYNYPAFLLMLVKSFYDTKRPDRNMAEVLKAPYDSLIPPMLNGCHTMDDVNNLLPRIPYACLTDEFVTDYMNNPNAEFKQYLHENSVYNWKPEAPMQLCYCNGDEEVDFKNAITAYETMKANGSESVKLKRAGKKFKHVNCALFASVYTKMFFDAYVKGGNKKGPAFKRLLLNIGKMAVKP
jgi:pimeloyl-ACP methyl ester carboxylesterase